MKDEGILLFAEKQSINWTYPEEKQFSDIILPGEKYDIANRSKFDFQLLDESVS